MLAAEEESGDYDCDFKTFLFLKNIFDISI
jgi:hypothetical protein